MKKVSEKEFLKRMAELRAWIIQSVDPFDDSPEERERRRERGRTDKKFFAETYFPHYIEDDWAKIHDEMFRLADKTNVPVIIAGFRGCAKSVLISLIDVIHKIVYEQRHFFLFISSSEEAAMEYTGPIKEELENNPRLKMDFGDLVRRGYWEYGDFRTTNGIRVLAMGRNGSVKGKRNGPYRPDHIIIEDIEDRNKSRSKRVIEHTVKWLKTDVLKGVNHKRWSFLFLGNYFSKKSIVHHFLQNENYIRRIYPAEVNGRSQWPSRFPIKILHRMREVEGSLVYDTEMLQIPRDEEDSVFQEEWIRYYDPLEIKDMPLRVFARLDPSAKKGENSDYKAIIIIGVSPDADIYVLHAWIKRRSKWQMIKAGYDLYREYKFEVLGLPDVAFESTLAEDFDIQAKEEGFPLPLKLMPERLPKDVRITKISSLVERGKIRFRKNHSDQKLLVDQLLAYPDGHDDGPDALAGAVEIAEVLKGGVKYESVTRRAGLIGLLRKGLF